VEGKTALPAAGTTRRRGGADIGELLSSNGMQGFALVRLDRLDESSGDILAGEIPVALTRAAWLASQHGE